MQEEVDAGGIILQAPVQVFPDDNHDTLSERIKKVEHKLFPLAMEAAARGDAVRGADGAIQWKNFDDYSSFITL